MSDNAAHHGSASPAGAFFIAGRGVGGEAPPFIIGEVAQAHDGSLGLAHAFIDAIAAAGADAVKFQTHLASAESTPREPWRVKFSLQDATRYDYWKRMEFTPDQWRGLRQHADDRGLVFLSSPFSFEAVDLLESLHVPAWKVASGEVANRPLLERLRDTGKPVLMSTGMSDHAELDAAVGLFRSAGVPLALLQCTTAYPCRPEQVGLEQLAALRARHRCPVGLSDHSAVIYAGLAAVALGAAVVEAHVTLSREMFGPDVPASLTTAELRQLVEGARFIHRALRHPVDKDALAAELSPLKRVFGRSLVARVDLPAGTVLTASHLAAKKPGGGLPPDCLPRLVGRRLNTALAADEPLREEALREETR